MIDRQCGIPRRRPTRTRPSLAPQPPQSDLFRLVLHNHPSLARRLRRRMERQLELLHDQPVATSRTPLLLHHRGLLVLQLPPGMPRSQLPLEIPQNAPPHETPDPSARKLLRHRARTHRSDRHSTTLLPYRKTRLRPTNALLRLVDLPGIHPVRRDHGPLRTARLRHDSGSFILCTQLHWL